MLKPWHGGEEGRGCDNGPNFQEYAIARAEDVSKLMVHSLMRVNGRVTLLIFFFLTCHSFVCFQSLNEAMVVSRHCLTAEDDLVRLKQRLAESEASEKNMKRAFLS